MLLTFGRLLTTNRLRDCDGLTFTDTYTHAHISKADSALTEEERKTIQERGRSALKEHWMCRLSTRCSLYYLALATSTGHGRIIFASLNVIRHRLAVHLYHQQVPIVPRLGNIPVTGSATRNEMIFTWSFFWGVVWWSDIIFEWYLIPVILFELASFFFSMRLAIWNKISRIATFLNAMKSKCINDNLRTSIDIPVLRHLVIVAGDKIAGGLLIKLMSHVTVWHPSKFFQQSDMSSLAFLVTELQVSYILLRIQCKLNEIVSGERNQEEASRDTRGVCLSSPNMVAKS